MKKTEQHNKPYPQQVYNSAVLPHTPVSGRQQDSNNRNTDPSSTFRSSRYPVPSFEHRVGATQ